MGARMLAGVPLHLRRPRNGGPVTSTLSGAANNAAPLILTT